jgi:hypothetical protein
MVARCSPLEAPSLALAVPRAEHNAVRLESGEVLITGGLRGGLLPDGSIGQWEVLKSAEIFDPISRTFRSS